jgi:hypothetical protein
MFVALIKRLSEAVGERDSVGVVIYAPFGIVRGVVSRAELNSVANEQVDRPGVLAVDTPWSSTIRTICLRETHARLLISISEISGLVVVGEPGT